MDNTSQVYHKSVLVKEVIAYLEPQPNKVYVDATFGGGGHTREILKAQPNAKVIAFDWDQEAIDKNGPVLIEEFGERIELIRGNFAHITPLLKKRNILKIDGILADFGTAQTQIQTKPGLSFGQKTALDMRMSSGFYKITARDIVNNASENELNHIFFTYGEEPKARAVARAIVNYRVKKKINTTDDLVQIINSVIPKGNRRINPATKVFQALRIVVNDELNNIKSLLAQSINLLNSGGRLICISFHSLEDRLVKQFFKENGSLFTNLTPKVIMAQLEEIEKNPSARSAKLRAAERK